jgi:hypothetical protein
MIVSEITIENYTLTRDTRLRDVRRTKRLASRVQYVN